MLSAVNVKVVSTLLLFGFTPRFSQLIHDNRAVRSANMKEINVIILVSPLHTDR
jgi:hypothetical protein